MALSQYVLWAPWFDAAENPAAATKPRRRQPNATMPHCLRRKTAPLNHPTIHLTLHLSIHPAFHHSIYPSIHLLFPPILSAHSFHPPTHSNHGWVDEWMGWVNGWG